MKLSSSFNVVALLFLLLRLVRTRTTFPRQNSEVHVYCVRPGYRGTIHVYTRCVNKCKFDCEYRCVEDHATPRRRGLPCTTRQHIAHGLSWGASTRRLRYAVLPSQHVVLGPI